ncbi:glycoside hydrolase family 28 protein [uncultured Bacteroides sp.]|uniref:glycoside hydrolase family 28 protein n=1 Tax=uncultured Bacteroides sp. TaxID=162156 RepID=UPI002AAA6EF3|nr:glycoside hydrolase family 28 protein [uncultured Bacteroides sp.]
MNKLIKKYILLSLASALPLLYSSNMQAASKDNNIDPAIYNGIPFKMAPVVQPSFPNYIVNIVDFGAKGDGVAVNTKAINDAIKKVNANGGGTVVIPSGLWLTGPIELLSNVNLYTEQNALVLFTNDYNAYPVLKTSFEGMETRRCQSPISARNASNIAITGNGAFDGSGDAWRPVKKDKLTESQWKELIKSGGVLSADKKIWYPTAKSIKGALACENFNNPTGINTDAEWESIRDWLRPVMVSIVKCKKVLLQGVTFKNSPSWCLHPLSCEDITINNVNVSNPWYSQNGDALDMESCKNALIINSTFDAGDDAICLKSGKDEDGRRRGEPCENVIVKNNVVLHGHGGFVVGSEMSGGVKNIFVSNCSFIGTDVGLRFKSTRGRGGVVENIYIEHINMINIPNEPLLFDLFYGGKAPDELTEEDKNANQSEVVPPVSEKTPAFKDIHISDIYCKKAGRAMFFNGLPEMRIQNVTVKDVVITDAKEGAVISQANGVIMDNIKITSPSGNSLSIKNASNIKIDGILFKEVNEKGKTVIFK